MPRELQPCELYDIVGHPTNIYPELNKLKPLLSFERNFVATSFGKKELATNNPGKSLSTNHTCTIHNNYGNYTHNFLEIPQYRDALHAIEQSYQEDPPMQLNGEEPRAILYLQVAWQSPERLPFVPPPPVQRCALCEEHDYSITVCVALQLFQRWYLVNPVYHVDLLAI